MACQLSKYHSLLLLFRHTCILSKNQIPCLTRKCRVLDDAVNDPGNAENEEDKENGLSNTKTNPNRIQFLKFSLVAMMQEYINHYYVSLILDPAYYV